MTDRSRAFSDPQNVQDRMFGFPDVMRGQLALEEPKPTHHCPRCGQGYPGGGFVCFGPTDGAWCHRATAMEAGHA